MTNIFKCGSVWAVSLALLASPVLAKDKSEDELIKDLESPSASTVTSALQQLEKLYPTSTKAFPAIKKLLPDSRSKVRRKAARVLGALHADVDQDNIKAICALLKAPDVDEMTDGLKALRGLKAPGAVPEITPLLQHANTHIIRDACRTLAVLGNKQLVPTIEPLLKHADPAVRKDAQDAIAALLAKP